MRVTSRAMGSRIGTVAMVLALNACEEPEQKTRGALNPRIEVTVRDQDLTTARGAEISSIRVDDRPTGADRFTFVITNGFDPVSRELRFLDLLQSGQPVEIRMGNRDGKDTHLMVEGTIDSISTTFPAEGSAQLTVGGASVRVDPGEPPTEPIRLEWGRGLLTFSPEVNLAERVSEVEVVGTAESIGTPSLRAGVKVELAGLGEEFSKVYYVSKSTHTADAGGYRTTFDVQETTR